VVVVVMVVVMVMVDDDDDGNGCWCFAVAMALNSDLFLMLSSHFSRRKKSNLYFCRSSNRKMRIALMFGVQAAELSLQSPGLFAAFHGGTTAAEPRAWVRPHVGTA
jgi:hypothetical protein